MGNYTSKLFSYRNDNESRMKIDNDNASVCDMKKIRLCTPPMNKRKLATDPRSATIGISRTPIEVTRTPPESNRRIASAVPWHLLDKRYMETNFDDSTHNGTPDKRLLDPRSPDIRQRRTPIMVKQMVEDTFKPAIANVSPQPFSSTLDPRSPAIDFDRTPILQPRTGECSIDNSPPKETSTNRRIGTVSLSYCETTTDFGIPEIRTIATTTIESDVTPCDVSDDTTDNVDDADLSSDTSGECDEQITVIRVTDNMPIDARSDDQFSMPPAASDPFGIDDDAPIDVRESTGTTEREDKTMTRKDGIKVWRDSVSPDDVTKSVCDRKTTNTEIIIEFDDDTIAHTFPVGLIDKSDDAIDDCDDKMTIRAKKKRSRRRYEDENKSMIDEGRMLGRDTKNFNDLAMNRTPLANRSNNHKQRHRPGHGKSPLQLLRNKGLSGKATIQQENTPPPAERFATKTKPHGIQWDADTTIVI